MLADDLVVLVACDAVYAREHAAPLAASLAAADPGRPLHVHIVNPEPGSAAPFARTSSETVDFGDAKDGFRRTWYACARFVRAAAMMRAAPATYLLLDADSLVRAPLRPLLEAAQPYDLMLHRRPDAAEPHRATAAGCALFRPTPAAQRFLDLAAALIVPKLRDGSAYWYLDQEVLTLLAAKVPARIGQVPRAWLDWEFGEASPIWTGKGARKEADARYAALRRRFAA